MMDAARSMMCRTTVEPKRRRGVREVREPVKVVAEQVQEWTRSKLPSIPPEDAGEGQKWSALGDALRDGGCTELFHDLGALQDAVASFNRAGNDNPDFWTELLPFACEQALRYTELFPEPIPIVDVASASQGTASRIVEWTQVQCLCIQCNAFLCSWPERMSQNCHCREGDLPSINLDEMHCARGNRGPQAAKCEMFLHYLAKQYRRLQGGDTLDSLKVRFVRRKVEPQQSAGGEAVAAGAAAAAAGVHAEPDWHGSAKRLGRVTVRPLRESIDAAKDMLRADFANESIGGGSIAYGCVQEEIMFACHPELNCARLVFTPMLKEEAFILCGAEQFARPDGYAFGLRCGGPYKDETATEGDQLRAFVTAIDAMDYRGRHAHIQYQPHIVQREMLKAFAGFKLPPEVTERAGCSPPTTLATGNWGAGAFEGDGRLKALIQWAAASEAGLDMHYFPFDDQYLAEKLGPVVAKAVAAEITVGALCQWLLDEEGMRATLDTVRSDHDGKRDVLTAFEKYVEKVEEDGGFDSL